MCHILLVLPVAVSHIQKLENETEQLRRQILSTPSAAMRTHLMKETTFSAGNVQLKSVALNLVPITALITHDCF